MSRSQDVEGQAQAAAPDPPEGQPNAAEKKEKKARKQPCPKTMKRCRWLLFLLTMLGSIVTTIVMPIALSGVVEDVTNKTKNVLDNGVSNEQTFFASRMENKQVGPGLSECYPRYSWCTYNTDG